ncbi:MAG: hypothetical protein RLP09_35925 [Sandaracinaceae bacterium]
MSAAVMCLASVIVGACGPAAVEPVDAGPGVRCASEARLVDGSCRAPERAPCESGLRDGVTGECVTDDRCPRGTVREGDECVALSECVDGTVREGGECVPDGSVLCGAGTVFDAETGRCVADPGSCGAGTVLVDGRCVPYDDTLEADTVEGSENNDPERGGRARPLTLAEIGDTTSIRGCVEPADLDGDGALDADRDGYLFTVSEPTVLRVRVDGVHGASGGFMVLPDIPALATDGWRRLGVSLVGDDAERELFLPHAGRYILLVSDSRSLVFDAAVGGPDACYFATIERRPMPSPTRFAHRTEGPLSGVRVLETTTERAGETFVSLRSSSRAATAAVTLLDGDRYLRSMSGPGPGAVSFETAPHAAGETLTFVVEPEVRPSVTEPRFELELEGILELGPGRSWFSATEAQRGLRLRLVATTRSVKHITWTAGDASARVFVEALRSDSSAYGEHQPCGRGACTGSHRHVIYSGAAETYFLRVRAGTPTSLAFDVETIPVAVEPLRRREYVSMEPDERLYFVPSVSQIEWLTIGTTSGSLDASIGVFDRVRDGELGEPTWGDLASPAGAQIRNLVARPGGDTLVVVQSDEPRRAGFWHDFFLRTDVPPFPSTLSMGPLSPGVPYVLEEPWPTTSRWTDREARFFVRVPPGQALRVRASHPDAETIVVGWRTMPSLFSLAYTVSTGGWWVGPAPPVEDEISGAPEGWRLLSVSATFDLEWGTPPPDMRIEIEAFSVVDGYAGAEVPLATSSICPSRGGSGAVLLDGSTSSVQALTGVPEIRLFGLATGPLFASRHGTLSRASNTVPEYLTRPSELGTATVSAIGEWLTDASELCVLDDASALILEWDGETEAGVPAHAQIRVDRASHAVELSYFPDHALRLPPPRTVGLANRTRELLVLHEDPVPIGRTLRFTPRSAP